MSSPAARRSPVIMRSKLMLEVASHLVEQDDWVDKQVEIHFRPQGGEKWNLCFFASDAPNSIDAVVSGRATFAICNPGGVLAMATRGLGPFKEKYPLRAIMVLPQFDQYGFAVSGKTGLKSLADIRDQKYPLRVSLRGQRDHSVHLVADLVLSTYGYSLKDIESWGGQVRYDEEFPNGPNRIGAAERGEVDAVWDEALNMFARQALNLGMNFLPVDEPNLKQLEEMGLPRVSIEPGEYGEMPETVWTVDFSGWPLFCLESTPDDIVTSFCAGLDAKKDRIPWYGSGPMDLEEMVSGGRRAPMTIPLHPAAEKYWREHGYLK
jgi:TRAP-type uncharacterized transport system substrate-binding protein